MYRYLFLLALLFSGFLHSKAQPSGDIAVADVGPVDYLTPGTHPFNIGGYVHSFGMMYFPYEAAWSFNNGPWEVHSATPILASVNRRFKVTLPVTPSITVNAPGVYPLKVVIKCASITDTNPSNDTLVKMVRVLNALPPKNVLLETMKFQACAPCYPADTAVSGQLVPKPYMNVARLYIAPGEPLYNPNADTVDDAIYQLPGHPVFMYDRFRFPHNASQAVSAIEIGTTRSIADTGLRVHYLEPVSVYFEQVLFDSSIGQLSVTLKGEIFDTLSGDYRFNLYVTEDSIFTWQTAAPGGQYYHNRVARMMLGGSWGSYGSLPATLLPGESHTYTYTAIIPSSYKPRHLRLIGLIQHKDPTDVHNHRVLNSVGGPLSVLVQTAGIASAPVQSFPSLYPNPASGFIVLAGLANDAYRLRLYEPGGRLLREWYEESRNSEIRVDLEDVPAGLYTIEAGSQRHRFAGRIVKKD